MAPVVRATPGGAILKLTLARPSDFDDLSTGDSVAVDGCCLTIERLTPTEIEFALGPETRAITGWTPGSLEGRFFNLERSLRLNDRVHGHPVTGHVDASVVVAGVETTSETMQARIALPDDLKTFVWRKGSVALNGVSLTVNDVTDGADGSSFAVGLIPETLRRTNLAGLTKGARCNFEIDNVARGLVRITSLAGGGRV